MVSLSERDKARDEAKSKPVESHSVYVNEDTATRCDKMDAGRNDRITTKRSTKYRRAQRESERERETTKWAALPKTEAKERWEGE